MSNTEPVLLVKFYFTNARLIPPGLSAANPDGSNGTRLRLPRDTRHAVLARIRGRYDLAQAGRIRTERDGTPRIDTGEQIMKESMVSAVGIMDLLRGNKLSLLDAHTFPQRKPGRPQKHVVVLGFGYGEEFVPSPETSAGIARLENAVWEHAHIWDNSALPNMVNTVNLTGVRPDASPRHKFTMIQGGLDIIPT